MVSQAILVSLAIVLSQKIFESSAIVVSQEIVVFRAIVVFQDQNNCHQRLQHFFLSGLTYPKYKVLFVCFVYGLVSAPLLIPPVFYAAIDVAHGY